jgi:hypothetical protein
MTRPPRERDSPTSCEVLIHPKREQRLRALLVQKTACYTLVCHAAQRAVDEILQRLVALDGRLPHPLALHLRAECDSILAILKKFEDYAESLDAAHLPSGEEIMAMMERVRGLGLRVCEAIESSTGEGRAGIARTADPGRTALRLLHEFCSSPGN